MGLSNVSRFVEEETVHLDGEGSDKNPGHCINDLIFSLAMDIVHRERYLLGRNGSTAVYPKFIYGGITSPRYDPGECHEFCCDFLSSKLGFIRYPRDFVSSTDSGTSRGNDVRTPRQVASTVSCFAKLVIPRVSALRYDFHLRNPSGMEALKMIQSHMFHNKTGMSKLLDSVPWSVQESIPPSNSTTRTPAKSIPIMLYGR